MSGGGPRRGAFLQQRTAARLLNDYRAAYGEDWPGALTRLEAIFLESRNPAVRERPERVRRRILDRMRLEHPR